jgi:CheY-like chemotaxis protein
MKKKILLVEDNKTSAFYTKTNLESLGYICDIAEDVKTAIHFFVENNYNAILMDISLGDEMNGYDATRKIRRLEVKYKKNPAIIIALTGHARKDVYDNCLAAGMNDVLEKPLGKENFKQLLEP